jgi:hypothetical protein
VEITERQRQLLADFVGAYENGDDLLQRLIKKLEAAAPPPTSVYQAPSKVKHAPNAPAITMGIPTRGEVPVEFCMSLIQMLHPLNTAMTYTIQPGMLPAAARNAIVETALSHNIQTIFFLDDDVLFPDIALYRLWVAMQKHPEAAVITGIYTTKIEPCEPILYQNEQDGAFWDWPLGTLVPIHSAGAGCMLVNMEYVKKLKGPWFDDVLKDSNPDDVGGKVRNRWGHDRFFMMRMRDEAGGVIYADTGLLLSHWDKQTHRNYVLPPDSPCFQKPLMGEAWVPALTPDGIVIWRRLIPAETPSEFMGYLTWLQKGRTKGTETVQSMVGESA